MGRKIVKILNMSQIYCAITSFKSANLWKRVISKQKGFFSCKLRSLCLTAAHREVSSTCPGPVDNAHRWFSGKQNVWKRSTCPMLWMKVNLLHRSSIILRSNQKNLWSNKFENKYEPRFEMLHPLPHARQHLYKMKKIFSFEKCLVRIHVDIRARFLSVSLACRKVKRSRISMIVWLKIT